MVNPTPSPSSTDGEGNDSLPVKQVFIGWAQWRKEKRALGWYDCPMCQDGMLYNRFSRRISVCDLCDGAGVLKPETILRG